MTAGLVGPVAVTGADGFIGRHVVAALRDQDVAVNEIVGPHREPSTPERSRSADLTDEDEASRALRGAGSVVHLAARSGGIQVQQTSAARLFFDNVSMTRNVLRAAAAAGCRRAFLASSAVVYSSRASQHPLTESAATISPGHEGVTPYAWGKLTDEQLGWWHTRQGDLEVVAGRFANVYGPGASFDPSRSTVVHALVKKAVDAGPDGVLRVWGTGQAQRSFVHVLDAGQAVVTILASGEPGRAYNISSSGPVTIAELAQRLVSVVEGELALQFQPDKPEGVARRVLDETALRELDFEPAVALDDGLRQVVAAYRETGIES